MADYSAMPALEVWYDVMDLERVLKALTREKDRQKAAVRVEKARLHSVPDYMFPKLTEQQGTTPRIVDHPPLIFHPPPEHIPEVKTGFDQAIARYRDTLHENIRTLFDRYAFADLAFKVVGVGSVGTGCYIALFLAANDDPLFLQVKEAKASVLEPFAGKSLHPHHGERVVAGQRVMQSASDIFLGWTMGENRRHVYVRQLRDAKVSAVIDSYARVQLRDYARLSALCLERAHGRCVDAPMISGYIGASDIFDQAIGEFAVEYADQNEIDYKRFVDAVKKGKIEAVLAA